MPSEADKKLFEDAQRRARRVTDRWTTYITSDERHLLTDQISTALIDALSTQREADCVAICFRCQNKEGYSVAQLVGVPEGTETSGAKAWQHTDRGGSLFPCLAAAIRGK